MLSTRRLSVGAFSLKITFRYNTRITILMSSAKEEIFNIMNPELPVKCCIVYLYCSRFIQTSIT